MVETAHFQCRGWGFNPGQEPRSHMLWGITKKEKEWEVYFSIWNTTEGTTELKTFRSVSKRISRSLQTERVGGGGTAC